MKSKFDKTKENIGVLEIDESSRKELFKKFQEAGGQVISEREKRRKGALQREILPQNKNSSKLKTRSIPAAPSKKKSIKKPASPPPATEPGPVSSRAGTGFSDRLYLRLKLFFSRTVTLDGKFYHKKFMRSFQHNYNPALMEIQIAYYDLFVNNSETKQQLMIELDRINPLYYELIEMSGTIYDKMMMDDIIHHYKNFPELPQHVESVRGLLLKLFKQLYILKPYESIILFAYERAVDQIILFAGKKNPRLTAMKRKVKSELNEVFNELYPRLHLIFCLFENRWFEENNRSIESIIGITLEDKPGNRTGFLDAESEDNLAAEREDESENVSSEEEKDEKVLDDLLRKGMELMYAIDIRDHRKRFDKNDHYHILLDTDTVLLTYLYFKEFDVEYSTILTNSAIKFRQDFGIEGDRVDYRSILADLYDTMREIYREIDTYNNDMLFYEKTRRQRPQNNDQYIAYTQRLEELNKKCAASGKKTRSTVRVYMRKMNRVLGEINEDINSAQRFIENPQEQLFFDVHIEGVKKLQGKKIYDAFYTVQCFTAAFEYRLGPMGDLGGKTLEEEDDDHGTGGGKDNDKSDDPGEELNDLV